VLEIEARTASVLPSYAYGSSLAVSTAFISQRAREDKGGWTNESNTVRRSLNILESRNAQLFFGLALAFTTGSKNHHLGDADLRMHATHSSSPQVLRN
jgi:hypothetical protein